MWGKRDESFEVLESYKKNTAFNLVGIEDVQQIEFDIGQLH